MGFVARRYHLIFCGAGLFHSLADAFLLPFLQRRKLLLQVFLVAAKMIQVRFKAGYPGGKAAADDGPCDQD